MRLLGDRLHGGFGVTLPPENVRRSVQDDLLSRFAFALSSFGNSHRRSVGIRASGFGPIHFPLVFERHTPDALTHLYPTLPKKFLLPRWTFGCP
jgi:hypothetical protein